MIGVVMTVNPIKHLDRHAEKAGGFPFINAVLHEPGCRRVPQSMRRDVAAHATQTKGRLEGGFHRFYRLTVPLNEVLMNEPFGRPPAQMGQQARGQWHSFTAILRSKSS